MLQKNLTLYSVQFGVFLNAEFLKIFIFLIMDVVFSLLSLSRSLSCPKLSEKKLQIGKNKFWQRGGSASA